MMRRLALLLVRVYQRLVSPWMPPVCRFEPTCSRYAAEAIERHGAWRGGWLALRRLLRCRPGGGGGLDPVPGGAARPVTDDDPRPGPTRHEPGRAAPDELPSAGSRSRRSAS